MTHHHIFKKYDKNNDIFEVLYNTGVKLVSFGITSMYYYIPIKWLLEIIKAVSNKSGVGDVVIQEIVKYYKILRQQKYFQQNISNTSKNDSLLLAPQRFPFPRKSFYKTSKIPEYLTL